MKLQRGPMDTAWGKILFSAAVGFVVTLVLLLAGVPRNVALALGGIAIGVVVAALARPEVAPRA